MAANENAEVVRRGYEALNKADIATLTKIMDENASWHTGAQPDRRSLPGP
jgi:ketosteroid isomerase-like protein